jgi:hypothetical protein
MNIECAELTAMPIWSSTSGSSTRWEKAARTCSRVGACTLCCWKAFM